MENADEKKIKSFTLLNENLLMFMRGLSSDNPARICKKPHEILEKRSRFTRKMIGDEVARKEAVRKLTPLPKK